MAHRSVSVRLGHRAETLACSYLKSQGLRLVKKNYRIKGGEIDLIMYDQAYLIFIEVKSRLNEHYGNALEMISLQKKRCIIHTAHHYLQTHKLTDTVDTRFDVIGISKNTNQISWIKNAFEVQY